MSKEVDNRVVQMEFDNKKFESNAKESINTIDKLKKSLDFEKSVKSLSSLEKSANKFSLDGISKGVEAVSNRFTTMGIIGMTAIENLTNSAINAGKNLIKSLTIDPVKTGLDEYETKMNAITTILTNTESKGTTLDDVNKTLNELNTYADKTIYNFAEMTKNIGTFTAAGVGLKDSAVAIKGIANLAAGSGSNAQQASTAMYQLSQALSSGTVKLMDWNSVINAGMGGEKFQKALEKTAVRLGNGRNMAVSFRDSLQDGWITSEVLLETLKEFAADESLVKAATQVKTLTQLIDTMKESVQSGWAQSWENIIGDREEAASLFTALNNAFGSVVGASADARNGMLKFWKENQGREYIIKGIANVLLFMGQVIQPIKDAFSEIFPPMTGQKLVEISKHFKEFTDKLKIGSETADNIKRTFKGLFSVLNIGKELFIAVASGIGSIIKYFAPASSGVLGITGNIGDFFVSLNQAVEEGNIFSETLDRIGRFVEPVGRVIKDVISKISEAFSKFDFTSMEKFKKSSYDIFKPFIKFGELLTVVWSKISPVLGIMWNALGKFFDGLKIKMENLTGTDVKNFFDMMLSGGFIVAVSKFLKQTESISSNFGKLVGKVTDVLGSVKDTLKTYQKEIKANIIQKIAIAVGILAASLIALTFVDKDKITGALVSIGTLLVLVTASLLVISKQLGDKNLSVKMSLTLISLASAVAILAKSIYTIAGIETGENKAGVIAALASVVVMLGALVGVAVVITKMNINSKQVTATGLGLIPLTIAVLLLSKSIASIGSLPLHQLTQGGIAVTALIVVLGLFSKLCQEVTRVGKMTTNANMLQVGIGSIALATSMLLFAKAIAELGKMPINQLLQGGGAISVLMVAMGLLVKMSKDTAKFLSVGIGILAVGVALKLMMSTIKTLSDMDPTKMWIAIGGLSAVMTVMGMLAYMSKDTAKFLSVGAGMLAVGIAIKVIMSTITELASMDPNTMWIAIGGLSAIMVAMGILAMLSTSANPVGILALAAAVGILAIALKGLALLNPDQLKIGIIGLGVAIVGIIVLLGLLVAAVYLLAPLAPQMAILSVGLLQLSGAIALFGVGMLAFAVALGVLSVVGTGIIALLAALGVGIIAGIVAATVALAKATPILVDSLTIIGNGILQIISNLAEPLAETIAYLILVTLETLEKYADPIVTAVLKLVGEIFKALGRVLWNFGFDAGTKLGEAMDNMWASAKDTFDGLKDKMKDVGIFLIDGLTFGMFSKVTGLVKDVKTIGQLVIDTFKSKKVFDEHSPSREGYELGKYVTEGLGNGIRDNGTYPSFTAGVVGGNIIDSLSEGIDKKANEPVKKVEAVMSQITEQFSKASYSAGPAGRGMTKSLSDYLKSSGKSMTDIMSESSSTNLFTEAGKSLYSMFDNPKDTTKSTKSITDDISKNLSNISKDADKATKSTKTLDEAYQNSVDWINDRKYYNKLSLEEELAAWERIQKRYKVGSEERKNADKEIYRVKKEIVEKTKALEKESYQNSVDWINDRKQYNELSLKEELAAWKRVQSRYLKGTEERQNADKEVYRIRKEITDKLKQLDDDYYTNEKELNKKRTDDINNVNKEYNDAVESRAKSIYDSYSLFDKVEKDKEKVSGTELFSNLQDQVLEMRTWEDEMSKLVEKGVAKGLIEELQAMGPKSVNQIKTLNSMSESRLDDYVNLWVAKHNLAHNKAVYELDGLRVDTDKTIAKINEDTKTELNTLETTWIDETKDLRLSVQEEFKTLTDSIKETVQGQDWISTGINVMTKIMDGFVVGSSIVKNVLSKALNLELNDVDTSPTIKPVLDLSNIEAGKKQLNRFANPELLSGAVVAGSTSKAASNVTQHNTYDNRIEMTNTYVVRNDSDIRTISKDLKNIINKNNNAKGVLVP